MARISLIIVRFVVVLLCTNALCIAAITPIPYKKTNVSFSHLYHTKVVSQLRGGKKSVIWTKESVPPFTEVIVSWNAKRPTKGYYEISVNTR